MLILIICVFIVGVCAGWISHSEHLRHTMMNNPSVMEMMIRQVKRLKEMHEIIERKYATRIVANYEQHGKMWYLFAVDDDKFLGQGLSEEEALENAKVKYPGIEIAGK